MFKRNMCVSEHVWRLFCEENVTHELIHFEEWKICVNMFEDFLFQKLCFVRSCCLEEGRLPLPVWRINSENKCDVCAQAFWWTKSVSEQIRSVHFEKENYCDTFLRKRCTSSCLDIIWKIVIELSDCLSII